MQQAGRYGAGAVVESLHPVPKAQGRKREVILVMTWVCGTPKLTPSDTLSSIRPYLPIISKKFYKVRTKYSNI